MVYCVNKLIQKGKGSIALKHTSANAFKVFNKDAKPTKRQTKSESVALVESEPDQDEEFLKNDMLMLQ